MGGLGSRSVPGALQELATVLRSALVSDALDRRGHRSHCLDAGITAIEPGGVLVGRAFTVAVEAARGPGAPPYVGLLAAIEALGPDDVYVIASGPVRDVALWGELLTNVALARGAVGALCDGFVRDTAATRELGFPVFSRGAMPYDINGRLEVTGHGAPLAVGGVVVEHGDLIVGDDDGVVVIPAAVEREVIADAVAKAESEAGFRASVRGGMSPSRAYELHQVL
jgi:4-hydroxy-4-methyl-2-oxoglutarate aldolase